MKAVYCSKYGPPEVLKIVEKEKPMPAENEVLVRIRATVAAPADSAFREGKPVIARLFSGLSRPKNIPGDVFSGVIEATGKDVTLFKAGDEIYGSSGTKFGTNAEYITLPENGAFTLKPGNLSFGEASALSEGAITALPFLRDSGKISKDSRVMIIGASGGVGVYAVQLSKYFGAHVTAVCGPVNREKMLALGADRVIDYTKEDYTKASESYDIIYDAVTKSSFSRCKKALKPKGIYLCTVPNISIMISMLLTSVSGKKKAVFTATGLRKPEEKRSDLLLIKQLAEEGCLKPVIDRTYSLDQIAQAHSYVDTGHKSGSVAISV